MFNYAAFPNQNMVAGLQRYFEHGIEPGSFMTAVLCNDLKEACGRADDINRHMLFEIVKWLWNEAPSGTWGSPEAFGRVLASGGVFRPAPAVVLNDEAVALIETDILEQGNVSDDR